MNTAPPPLSACVCPVSAGKANPFRGDPALEEQHPHHDWGHASARLLLWWRVPPEWPYQRPGHQTRCSAAGEMDPAASSKTVRHTYTWSYHLNMLEKRCTFVSFHKRCCTAIFTQRRLPPFCLKSAHKRNTVCCISKVEASSHDPLLSLVIFTVSTTNAFTYPAYFDMSYNKYKYRQNIP